MLMKDVAKVVKNTKVRIHYGKVVEAIDLDRNFSALKKYYGCTVMQIQGDISGISIWLS